MESLLTELETGPPSLLRIVGEIDMATADRFRMSLEEALSTDSGIVVDMAGVTFIDACGLRALLRTAEKLNGDAPLAVVNAPLVKRLLKLAGQEGLPSLEIR